MAGIAKSCAERPTGKELNPWHRPIPIYHRARLTTGTSIAKPGERGTPVVGDMIRLAALDLVLWIVRARMVGVAFDLERVGMHADDCAADTAGLGIPAHAIMGLEALRHGR